VSEFFSIYGSYGSNRTAIRRLVSIRNDRDGQSSGLFDQLDGQGTESSRASPYEHGVAVPNDVPVPSAQHPVCGGADEHVARGFCPTQSFGLRQALLGLYDGELGKTAMIRFIPPNPLTWGERRITPGRNVRIVGVQLAAMDDDFVADGDRSDAFSQCPDYSRSVAPSDVVIFVQSGLHSLSDDVYRFSRRRPDIVVIHSCRHDAEEDFSWPGHRSGNGFLFESVDRIPESRLSNHLREHRRRNRTEFRQRTQCGGMEKLGHGLVLDNPFDNIRIRYFFYEFHGRRSPFREEKRNLRMVWKALPSRFGLFGFRGVSEFGRNGHRKGVLTPGRMIGIDRKIDGSFLRIVFRRIFAPCEKRRRNPLVPEFGNGIQS